MYNMYPDYRNTVNVETNSPMLHRASSAELRRWEAQGADFTEPDDYHSARQVETADRAVMEQRERELDRQFGRISVKGMFNE